MYDFHYNHMKVKYPRANQLRLLLADRYDFSEYPLDHPFMMHLTVKHFKDELNSVPMREFVGLRPKCYAFLCAGKEDKNVV